MSTIAATLPPERKGSSPSIELQQRREQMLQAAAAGAWRTSPPAMECTLNEVRTLRFGDQKQARAVVLHAHGGGFRLGMPEMAGPFATALAERCNVEVLCPAYRLAPEHPFPAGLRDVARVIDALTESGTKRLILSGDSAGGGLVASLAAVCVQAGVPLRGLILLSPWLDLTVSNTTYRSNAASDSLFSRAAATEAAARYLQGWSAHDPLASASFADLQGFPPTHISVGDGEVLLDDAQRFHIGLLAAGVQSQLLMLPDMEHVAVTRSLELTGARAAFEAVTRFVDRCLTE